MFGKAWQMQFWFGEQWWREERYRGDLPGNPTLDQIDRAMERVAKLFDEKWWHECLGHPAQLSLFAKGTGPLSFIYELGADLLEIDGSLRSASVVHDLKQSSHFLGVRFELRVAAMLKRRGYDIEFRPVSSNGKSADIAARRGPETVFLELKRLDESKRAACVQLLATQVLRIEGWKVKLSPHGVYLLFLLGLAGSTCSGALGSAPKFQSGIYFRLRGDRSF